MSLQLPVLNFAERASQHCMQTCGSICCERIYHQETRLIHLDESSITQTIEAMTSKAQQEMEGAFGSILVFDGYVLPEKNDVDVVGQTVYLKMTMVFTCSQFDRAERKCGNYDNRPEVCRTAKCGEISNTPTFSAGAIRNMHKRVESHSVVDRNTALETIKRLI